MERELVLDMSWRTMEGPERTKRTVLERAESSTVTHFSLSWNSETSPVQVGNRSQKGLKWRVWTVVSLEP